MRLPPSFAMSVPGFCLSITPPHMEVDNYAFSHDSPLHPNTHSIQDPFSIDFADRKENTQISIKHSAPGYVSEHEKPTEALLSHTYMSETDDVSSE